MPFWKVNVPRQQRLTFNPRFGFTRSVMKTRFALITNRVFFNEQAYIKPAESFLSKRNEKNIEGAVTSCDNDASVGILHENYIILGDAPAFKRCSR